MSRLIRSVSPNTTSTLAAIPLAHDQAHDIDAHPSSTRLFFICVPGTIYDSRFEFYPLEQLPLSSSTSISLSPRPRARSYVSLAFINIVFYSTFSTRGRLIVVYVDAAPRFLFVALL